LVAFDRTVVPDGLCELFIIRPDRDASTVRVFECRGGPGRLGVFVGLSPRGRRRVAVLCVPLDTVLAITVHVLVINVERVATHCGHRLFVGIGNGGLRAPIGPRAWSDDPLVDDGHRVDVFVGRGVQFTLLLTIVVVCVGPGWSRLFGVDRGLF